MLVWLEDTVVRADVNAQVSDKLAVREGWVGIDAGLRSSEVSVKDVKHVVISWSELSSVDWVNKDSSSLVHGGSESTADVGFTISWLKASVFPAVFLDDGHDFGKAHVLLSSESCKLSDALALNTESLVHSLCKHSVNWSGEDLAEHGEKDGWEIEWKERGPVVSWSVDPSEEEVVVSIWESFVRFEPGGGISLVELLGGIVTEWEPSDVEASFIGLLEPGLDWCSLDTSGWPVPCVLRFNDVEGFAAILLVEPHGHDAMSSMTASSPHDHWVKSIWAHDQEEIT